MGCPSLGLFVIVQLNNLHLEGKWFSYHVVIQMQHTPFESYTD